MHATLRYNKETEEFLSQWDDNGTDEMLDKYDQDEITALAKKEPADSHQRMWLEKLAEKWPAMQEGKRIVHDELIYELDTDRVWDDLIKEDYDDNPDYQLD